LLLFAKAKGKICPMNIARRLMMPWARPCDLYSAPGRLIMKLALGEAPEAIPSSIDVRLGAMEHATKVDGGPIDRVLKKFGGRIRVVRIHAAAASLGQIGAGHHDFDDLEHAIGLSRTFRIDADHNCCIEDLVEALRQLDRVEQASPYYLCTLPFLQPQTEVIDLEYTWQAREQIRAAEAMAYEPGDPAVIVAIVDTGVAAEHPELRGRLRPGFDTVELGLRDLANGVQLLGDRSEADNDPEDEVGHGTSCAAIIGAAGKKIPPGLAGESGLLPIRVLGAAQVLGKDEPIGIGALSDIDFGVKSAIDLGATVINMSFGTPESALDENDPKPHADVVRYGLARGCIMIAASGNSGQEERFSPASLPGVIAVGAVDSEGRPASFSTRGEHVALCAPGERVVTAGLRDYQMVTGTSFAAPFVAATAALLVSRSHRRSHPLEAATLKRILCQAARPWPRGTGDGCGVGVLDVYAALRALDDEIDRPSRRQISL
jgi:subtilisin family serine protease